MLLITRRVGEKIMIGDDVVVHVMEIVGNTVRVGIQAPRSTPVYREEKPRRDRRRAGRVPLAHKGVDTGFRVRRRSLAVSRHLTACDTGSVTCGDVTPPPWPCKARAIRVPSWHGLCQDRPNLAVAHIALAFRSRSRRDDAPGRRAA